MMSGESVVVLDCGTHSAKTGFSGESLPRLLSPTVLGRDLPGGVWVGSEALRRRRSCQLERPMERGRIVRWADMEKVWVHSLETELAVNPSDRAVLLTESPDEEPRAREQKAEIFFESIGVPRFCLANQAVLGLYAEGRTSGVVVNMGAGAASVVPVADGNMCREGLISLPSKFTGERMTMSLLHSLSPAPLPFRTASAIHKDIVNHIKDSLAYVSPRSVPTGTDQHPHTLEYSLPDASKVSIKTALLNMESLFFGDGTRRSLGSSVRECLRVSNLSEVTGRRVVLCGGVCDCPGLRARLASEVRQDGILVSEQSAIGKCRYLSWVGGSVLGSLSTFDRVSVSAAEYEEFGSGLINQRCAMDRAVMDTCYAMYGCCGA